MSCTSLRENVAVEQGLLQGGGWGAGCRKAQGWSEVSSCVLGRSRERGRIGDKLNMTPSCQRSVELQEEEYLLGGRGRGERGRRQCNPAGKTVIVQLGPVPALPFSSWATLISYLASV